MYVAHIRIELNAMINGMANEEGGAIRQKEGGWCRRRMIEKDITTEVARSRHGVTTERAREESEEIGKVNATTGREERGSVASAAKGMA